MTLAALIRKRETGKPANANPANVAKDGHQNGEPLAELAALALANPPEAQAANSLESGGNPASPADERVARMIAKLDRDSGLRYAIETDADAEPDAVILTVAIRGKGACELRIPKSRYDAFALLELIEKHTARETLQ